MDEFLFHKRESERGVLTYTFHPHVIGRGHRMLLLKRLIKRLATEGAIFVTIAEACDAYRVRYRKS